MTEIIQSIDWTEVIIKFITMILAPLVAILILEAKKWIRAKTENELLKKFGDMILDSVSAAKQTMVDDLKKGGNFDAAKQMEVFNTVKMKFYSHLTERAKHELELLVGDIEDWIYDRIHKEILELKAPKPPEGEGSLTEIIKDVEKLKSYAINKYEVMETR